MEQKFKELLNTLSVATSGEEKENILGKILENLTEPELSRAKYRDIVQSGNFIHLFAQAMKENMQWAKRTPKFVPNIPMTVYFESQWDIPKEQTIELVESIKEYLKVVPTGSYVRVFRHVLRPFNNKLLFLNDEEFFSMIKRSATNKTNQQSAASALLVLLTATDQCSEWQLKIIKSEQFIFELLEMESQEEVWSLFGNLVQHPDAKTLLPPQVLEKASKGKFPSCTDVCAILSSENDAASLQLDEEYINDRVKELENLLVQKNTLGKYFRFNLVELILPFVNLSIADANKESLGKKAIEPLLKVVSITREKPLISNMEFCLERAKQEATKALWNLAFKKANCEIIERLNGKSILETVGSQTNDNILKKNIAGILRMFLDPQQNIPEGEAEKSHIMISYNWDHQPIVLRLVESLKAHGYNVWLDLEQMEGSIFSAMAEAIEKAEVVLMCVSQKYHESPNCRYEGEYCATRKVEVIPLMMQANYKPRGWLGILLGAKLWYNFYEETDWNTKVAVLVKVIGNRGKTNKNTKLNNNIPQIVPPVTPKTKSIKEWQSTDMLVWMKEEKIEKHYDTFIKHKFDGKALAEVKTLLLTPQNNISSFLEFLFDRLGIKELGEIFRITSAIRNLPQ